MKSIASLFALILAALFSTTALAADTPDVTVLSTVTQAMALTATNQIGPMAVGWLGAFMTLQFVITNIGLLKSGADLQDIFAKLLGFLFAGAISLTLLMQGPDFIDSVGHGLLGKFLQNAPSAGNIITSTLGLCSALVGAIVFVGELNTALAMVLVNAVLLIFAVGMYMALKVFMLYLELGMVVLLSPLSFSFLGLSALRDQGIAPLKSLISLAYRAILLGVIYSAFSGVVQVAGESLHEISWLNPTMWPKAANTILAMLCAFPVLGYLAFKSDSIAASLSSGSTSMGPGDVAGAAAAGAAAGAAIASGGVSATGAATKIPVAMSDFMKSLNSGGSVSNASSSGTGGLDASEVGRLPPPSPTTSRAGQSAAGLASLAGASPAATEAAVQTAGTGGGATEIEKAVVKAGGTPAQGKAISEAASEDKYPMRAYVAALAANPDNQAANVTGAGFRSSAPTPLPKSVTALLQDSQDAGRAARAAGATPEVVQAAGDAAFAGGSAQDIADAVTNAGGTPEQGQAAAGAVGRSGQATTDFAAQGSGAGERTGIGGAASPIEQKLDQFLMSQQSAGKKTTMDHVSNVGHHLAQEKAATHVAINTHHAD